MEQLQTWACKKDMDLGFLQDSVSDLHSLLKKLVDSNLDLSKYERPNFTHHYQQNFSHYWNFSLIVRNFWTP
jgi:hypothetical protein